MARRRDDTSRGLANGRMKRGSKEGRKEGTEGKKGGLAMAFGAMVGWVELS